MFVSPPPKTNKQQPSNSEIIMTSIDEFQEFSTLLEQLHFKNYEDVFDILKQFKIVSSRKYVYIANFAWCSDC